MLVRLLLALFVLLTVLGIAVLLLDEGPESTDGVLLDGAAVVEPSGTSLPGLDDMPGGTDGNAPAQLIPDGAPGAPDDGLAEGLGIRADGSVTGRVVDPGGTPLRDIPVLLYVIDDPWQDGLDGEGLSLKLGATRTDAEGAFQLPARSGATHTLLAGGIDWARVRTEDVAAADQLIVRLEDPRWIEGVVLEEESGEPVEDARVLVIAGAESLTGMADDEGAFRLAPLPFESVLVAAWAPGYDVGYVPDSMPGWEPVTVELPPGRDVVGTVVEAETGEPVVGAEVRFSMDVAGRHAAGNAGETADVSPVQSEPQVAIEAREETVFEQTLLTDEAGVFVVPGAPSSGFVLDVQAEGFVPKRLVHYESRALEAEEEINIRLAALGIVHGRVVLGPDEERVPDVPVQLLAEGKVLASGAANEAGEFAFQMTEWDGLARLFVSAYGPDGLSGTTRVRTRSTDEELLIRLAQPVHLRVTVVAGDEPLPGAQVAVQSGSGPEERTLATTGPEGTVELVHPLSSPDVERVFLQARHAGKQSLPLEVDLSAGPPGELLVLDVQGGILVEGVVMDAFGAPIPGAAVWTRGAVGVHADFEGRFRLGPLEEGRKARVSAVAQGFRETRQTIPELSAWMGELIITLEPIVPWAGRVLDATTGLPVEDFLARLQREEDTDRGRGFADSSASVERTPGVPGGFTAELPDDGRYRIKVMSRDYIQATSEALHFDGSTPPAPLDVFLSPAAILLLTVLDSAGRPVPGFNVRVVDAELADDPKLHKKVRKQSPSQRTDSNGSARFNLGEGGAYRLGSGSAGWIEPQLVHVTPGPAVQHTLHLPATGAIALRILDENGDPANRPRVTVGARGRDRLYEVLRRSTPRDAPVEMLFDVLPPGDYSVKVKVRGHETQAMTVVVLANRVAHERMVMRPADSGSESSGRRAGDRKRGAGGGRR